MKLAGKERPKATDESSERGVPTEPSYEKSVPIIHRQTN